MLNMDEMIYVVKEAKMFALDVYSTLSNENKVLAYRVVKMTTDLILSRLEKLDFEKTTKPVHALYLFPFFRSVNMIIFSGIIEPSV